MTTQATDRVVFQGQQYLLCNQFGSQLFEPEAYGLNPAPPSTACYRGWVADYEVSEALVLRDLSVFHDAGLPVKNHRINGPVVHGVAPSEPASSLGFNCCYRSLNLPIEFTGGLLVVRDFIRELARNMPSHQFWKFEVAKELLFERGRLLAAHDRSSVGASVREKCLVNGLLNRPEVAKDPALRAQIEAQFSFNYEFLL